MAYAIIKTGGKQYKVAEGDKIDIEKIEAEVGSEATFEALMVSDGSNVRLGDPTVAGASVTAEVVDQFKGKKIIAFKFKRRKGYHKKIGHRRRLTKLAIKSISG